MSLRTLLNIVQKKLFQGEIIKSGPDNGFIMNEGNLIIQSVKRSSEG